MTLLQKFKISRHQLWPKMDPSLEGAQQEIPFKINRFVLLVISLIYTSTSACVYFNWHSMRDILYEAGRYAELNTGDEVDKTNSLQYKQINRLYPTTLAIHFTTSVFCGFLYDHIGPKLTAALGQFFNILCWIFLSINTTSFNSTLIGFVFMGLGADTAFIPVLTIANLFPDASTFILTLIGAAASLSFAVPVTLSGVMKLFPGISFTGVCYLYIFVILVPCLITALLLFPLKPFKGIDDYEREKKIVDTHNIEDLSIVNEAANKNHQENAYGNGNANGAGEMQTAVNTSTQGQGSNIAELGKVESTEVFHLPYRRGSESHVALKPKVELNNGVDEEQPTENVKNGEEKKKSSYTELATLNEKEIERNFHLASIKLFFKLLITFPSITVITYFTIFNISIVYYGLVNETYFHYDPLITTLINILFPLSCIPCIFFGRIVNRYGAAVVIIMMNACSALMHLTALLKYRIFGIFSAVFNMFATSMYTSQTYCFIQNAFPTIVFGKFIGFSSLCGGLFSLLAQPLYDYSTSADGQVLDPSNAAYAFIGIFTVLFIPLTILKIKNYERVPEMFNNKSFKKSPSANNPYDTEMSKI